MNLLGQFNIDLAVGDFLQTFGSETVPVRGVTVAVDQSFGDPFLIRSGPSGSEVSEFQGRFTIAGGGAYEFGGPVKGPRVFIDWQGANPGRRAVVSFWDEPVRAFGSVPVMRYVETAIPPLARSVALPVDDPGSWFASMGYAVLASQTANIEWTPTLATLTATTRQVIGSVALGGQISLGAIPYFRSTVGLEVENLGAVNMDIEVEIFVVA